MSAFRFYISYPTNGTEYSDFIDITDDVYDNSAGNLKQNLASNDYDIGSIKFNKITLNLRNETGKYSDAINPLSVFTFKRDETILRIDWDRNFDAAACGSSPCGFTFLSAPVEVYKGLLDDNSSKFDATSQTQTFNFLGLESIIQKVPVNFPSLSVGDTLNTTVFNILNQTKIKQFLTVDISNINVDFDYLPDDISSLENKNCLEALDDILLITNSILYVKNSTVFVTSRGEGATSVFTFYGPSSDLGIENLHSVSSYTLGINRTFNFWLWEDTNISQSFADSIERYGERKKVIKSDLITDNGKITAVLNRLLNEFGFPKRELEIEVPLITAIVKGIFLLDKINIDYPSDYRANEDDTLVARYAQQRYGQATYVQSISSLIIDVATNWKILNRTIQVRNHKITFKVREV